MATFTPSGFYEVSRDASGNFVVSAVFRSDPVAIRNGESGTVFEVGQSVTVETDFYTATETIVAFTSDGIITLDSASGYYTLQTSNDALPRDTILDVNTNPFPVCFVKGTLIDTEQGAVPIEALAIGDKVLGSTGYRTVKWIGWRHYHAVALRTAAQRKACAPVRIRAGALGDHQPSQDLSVSPWHHIYLDGVLVRANDLVNGTSIFQDSNISEFSYYHVELDSFDVISAHGVFSESWADGGNRDFFQNVDVTTLRPEDKKRRLANRPGFIALRNASEIAVIHARFAARADEWFCSPVLQAA